MPDILIRDVDPAVAEHLKKRARRHGRSLQSELTRLLEDSVERDRRMDEFRGVQARLLASTASRPQSDSTALVREDRDR